MKNTVSTAVTQSDIAEKRVQTWVNDEARPLLDALRTQANSEYRTLVTLSTAATGVATTVWTSDAMPTNSAWLVEVRVVGFKASGAAQRVAYIRRGLFGNNAGVVSQEGATSAEYTQESAAGCDCTLSVSGQTVICQVTDDAANTYNWLCCVQVTRSREE